MEKFKELSKNKIVLILVFIASFFIVKEIKTQYEVRSGYKKGVDEVIKKYDEVASNTKEGDSVVENTRKEFTNIAKDNLDSKKDEKSKVFSAANYVWGAYIFNVRGRYDFCKSYGVDIREFVTAYKNVNLNVMNDVYKIMKADFKEHNLAFDENILYSEMKDAQNKMIKQDMLEVGKSWGTADMKLTCQNFNSSAEKIADIISLEKRMPEFTKIVIDGAGKFN